MNISDLNDDESNWMEEHLTAVAGEPQHSVEQNVVAADLAERLLAPLAPEDRLTLQMIDGEDASIKEVAEVTGWSESKVKVRAFRARKKVRETMEKLLSYRPRKPATEGAGE